jgi:hypothetical protein
LLKGVIRGPAFYRKPLRNCSVEGSQDGGIVDERSSIKVKGEMAANGTTDMIEMKSIIGRNRVGHNWDVQWIKEGDSGLMQRFFDLMCERIDVLRWTGNVRFVQEERKFEQTDQGYIDIPETY